MEILLTRHGRTEWNLLKIPNVKTLLSLYLENYEVAK